MAKNAKRIKQEAMDQDQRKGHREMTPGHRHPYQIGKVWQPLRFSRAELIWYFEQYDKCSKESNTQENKT